MLRDLYSNISPAATLAAATLAADVTGTAVDLQGFGSAAVILSIGVGGITFSTTNKVEFVMEHSDDNSTWAAVATADVQGPGAITSGIVRALIAAKAAADVQRIGYLGGRRYIRVTADFSGTHGTGTPIGCVVVRGAPDLSPA